MPEREISWTSIADEAERERRIDAALRRVIAQRSRAEGRDIEVPQLDDGDVWLLTRDERELAALWILGDESRMVLGDVARADEDSVTAEVLWAGLRKLASRRGWTGSVNFTVFPGDAQMRRVASVSKATRVATKMRADAHTQAAPDDVVLRSMTGEEFARYNDGLAEDFAQELVESGAADTLEAAREESSQQMSALLPDGLGSAGQHLWTVRHGDERVGILWLSHGDDRAFIYDIEMEPAFRGRGFGTQTLRLAAEKARAWGLPCVALNVFGNNEGAQRLYAREGYTATETQWSAPLGSRSN
ncbi:GNAT family N-acetyltransferase [Paramicrobacterium fandaimingii]|uniref:GNAT family N-acetyltransferase n=1 Tax=Paramicrobacterium fandaimingii TaxID=2708079 RepID=UPI001422266B|nr:GNAT family N-acetyltransferase [Microbacterium fandaimingii]